MSRKKRKNTQKTSKKDWFKVFIFCFSIILLISTITYFRRRSLEKHKVDGVCKIIDIKTRTRGSKNTYITESIVEYYVNNKRYLTSCSYSEDHSIGDCYSIIYSSINPDNMKVYFDKKIPCDNTYYKE